MDLIVEILTDQQFLGAILASIAFLVLGFVLRRKNLIGDGGKNVINTLVMKVAIPCMAFCAFMSDFDVSSLASNALILVLTLVLYAVFLVLGNLFFWKKGKGKRSVYGMIFAVGQ